MKFITPEMQISHPLFSREFVLPTFREAKLEITGLGLYRAFLNGKRVGDAYLTPGYNDYDAYLRYQIYDVTALLEENNRLEIILGDGWYKGRFGFDGGRTNIYGEQYLLGARLVVDGTVVLEADETWTTSDSCIKFSNIYDGEIRDDTYRITETAPCKAVQTSYIMTPEFAPPVTRKLELKPSLYISPKAENILDFGQNMVGFVSFVNHLPAGEEILLQYGEVLQNGCFYNENYRTAKAEYRYISDGTLKTVEPFFTFYGFRYVKVTCVHKINPDDFTGVVIYSDLEQTISCRTSNEKVNRLMANTLWGQRGNFVDVPTDCPQRDERLGWTGDAQVFSETACYQMDCLPFYRKYLRDLREEQTRYFGGNIPMFCPSQKGFAAFGGAVWADAATIIPWNLWRFYGDKEVLKENYPMMRDYTEVLIKNDISGGHILFDGFALGDWLALDGADPQSPLGGTDTTYIKSIYYWHSIVLTAKAAKALGIDNDFKKYDGLALEIRRALIDEFFTPSGRLAVDTQTGYVLSLYYGIYRDKARAINAFHERLQKDGYRIMCGFTGAPLLLPALFDAGMAEDAYRLLLREEFPSWLYCVNLGATTIWERWNSLLPDGTISGTGMNSLNHYAYGSVCGAIYSRVAGLKPAEPGWKSAVIEPHVNWRLQHIEAEYKSVSGTYRAAWRINRDATVTVDCTVPDGAAATIILECGVYEVTPGQHSYTYKPSEEYSHPYSCESLIFDLQQNEKAAAVLEKYLPALLGFPGSTPREAVRKIPLADHDLIPKIDAELRNIHISFEG